MSTSGIVHDGDTTSWGREWTGGRYSLVISCTSTTTQTGRLHWYPARAGSQRDGATVNFSCSPQGSRSQHIVQLHGYVAVLQGEFTMGHDARIDLSWARA